MPFNAIPISGIIKTASPKAIVFPKIYPYFPERNFVVTGVSKDSVGRILGGALVYLYDKATDLILCPPVLSDVNGNYSIPIPKGLSQPQTTTWYARSYKASNSIWCNSLLHFDGGNGSTVITDEYGHVWTCGGTAALTTTNPKFGTACLLTNATSWVYSSIYDYGFPSLGNKFTLEAWVNFSDLAQLGDIFRGQGYVIRLYFNGNRLLLYVSSNGTSFDVAFAVAGSFTGWSTGVWYKIVLDYDGATYRVFQGTSGALSLDISVSSPYPPYYFTALTNTLSLAWHLAASMDEFRMTMGNSRYGASATAETGAFTPDPAIIDMAGTTVNTLVGA